ncbi:MAG: PRC-barrel domain-containing protein [Chloroflexi bacterium]|nr:PRC-barrel domain-containing protein [Chloroflexota bacterium]
MKANEIKGLAVVSIADGAKLGHVDELYFDTQDMRLAAVRVANNEQQAILPFDQIRSVGKDAVTVPSNEVTQGTTGKALTTGLSSLGSISKLRVVDEAGTLLGTVTGLDLDPGNGHITEVQAHRGGHFGLGGTSVHVPGRAIRSIGAEIMMVVTEAPINPPTQ